MKKGIITTLCIALSVVFISGCSSKIKVSTVIKDDFDISQKTGFSGQVTYDISEADYQKYSSIMDALNAEPNRSEDEILADIAPLYGDSVEDLYAFLKENMSAAVDRDMGRSSSAPSDDEMKDIAKNIMKNIITDDSEVDTKTIEINNPNIRICLAKMTVNDRNKDPHEMILKYELSDDFSGAEITQVKENGQNIKLPN